MLGAITWLVAGVLIYVWWRYHYGEWTTNQKELIAAWNDMRKAEKDTGYRVVGRTFGNEHGYKVDLYDRYGFFFNGRNAHDILRASRKMRARATLHHQT